MRALPVAPDGSASGRLAYFNNSKTMANSNVLQVILRDHGYSRVEAFQEDWTIFWCAGQVEALELRKFKPYQKVGLAPRAVVCEKRGAHSERWP